MFHGAGVFFGDDSALPAWLLGALMWLVPSIILAVVWALAWGRSRQGVRVLCALLVLSVPPIGVFGWANPVTSAGALFPGLGWIGLALTVGLLYVLAQHARPALAALPFVLLAAVVNLSYRAPSVDRWIAVDTHIGSARDAFGEFDRLQALKAALANARAQNPHAVTFVLPELVGGDWSMNRIWWDHEAVDLAAHGQTVLVGAYLPQDKNRRYVNALVSIGADRDQVLVDRVPVPISMWRPLSNTGAIAYWAHGGVARVGGKRAAALICYEELLIWPALLSAAQSPDIFVGSANDWWARGTSIPAIQREATATWARLFGKPFVWAHNV
ncbi:nitrilase-related carbon-nitrogen hydrolase [Paraburkholderia humisilvae]|uniref:CN hydrolase domain-containing protein n=1 Tax=Paraburkholderia humisilvae TaxID=627669 RepID=A0A6J5DNT3_9BURK|nr:nitrilase-related carbon-nitrogen hydrolase [Paraburkholderia humisilvae]CAB3755909.1 hypothetical protein LMG29542_02726 [Paraburkholderia humisilvae]